MHAERRRSDADRGAGVTQPAILAKLRGVQRAGKGWVAFCPAHNDQHRRSLSVGLGDDGRTLLKCHAAGCTVEQIARAVEMGLVDLAPPSARTNGQQRTIARREVAAYDYTDERGVLLSQNVRFEPKDFRQRRPDGRGDWVWSMEGVRRVPYRLPELAEQARVFIAEGEKDCDALWALGVAATTNAAGAGKWTEEHTAALTSAAIADVIVLPDNDAPGEKHAHAVAASCHAAGLRVRILRLPDLPPKGDVSDWLIAGHTRDELLDLADAAPIFTADPVPGEVSSDEASEPDLRREGLDLVLVWPDSVRFVLGAIKDGRDGVRGELTVTKAGRRLSWTSFSLPSAQARETLRKKLEAIAPDVSWADYLEEAAWRFTQAARQGEPIVTLTGATSSPTRELMPRFLYEGEPTLVYGDGDTGKSLVALAIAAAATSGAALPLGLKAVRPVPAAYLDWETSRDTLEVRLALIAAGLGIDPPAVLYKRMTRPLVDEAAELAAEFARRSIGFVVIDSKMFAVAGGDGAAFHEPITAFYNALRLFAPAASLVLNHVTNEDARTGRSARPFGGAFAFNGPRLIWEAKRDQDVTDATAIVFTCKKANNLARKPEPFGLRFQPGSGTITVYPFDLTEAAPKATAGAPLTYRVRLAVASGVKTPDAIAEELGPGAKRDTIERILRRLRNDGKARETQTGWELVS
jgi:AAA domain/Toprim-like